MTKFLIVANFICAILNFAMFFQRGDIVFLFFALFNAFVVAVLFAEEF